MSNKETQPCETDIFQNFRFVVILKHIDNYISFWVKLDSKQNFNIFYYWNTKGKKEWGVTDINKQSKWEEKRAFFPLDSIFLACLTFTLTNIISLTHQTSSSFSAIFKIIFRLEWYYYFRQFTMLIS